MQANADAKSACRMRRACLLPAVWRALTPSPPPGTWQNRDDISFPFLSSFLVSRSFQMPVICQDRLRTAVVFGISERIVGGF